MTLTDQIDQCLPQTQCEECGYKGCKPYAEALAQGEAAINLCPPGGITVMENLSQLLDHPIAPAMRDDMLEKQTSPKRFIIDEDRCIGCVKCIRVCPTDAIVGAPKRMHSILAEDCSGCGRCVPACPMDCIDTIDRPPSTIKEREHWRKKFNTRGKRLEKMEKTKKQQHANAKSRFANNKQSLSERQANIQAALSRVAAKKKGDHDSV